MHEFIDFNFEFVSDPLATFYGRVEVNAMIEAGIGSGGITVIDKSVIPQDGDLVVVYVNDFVIRFLDLTHEKDGYILLQPANHHLSPFE